MFSLKRWWGLLITVCRQQRLLGSQQFYVCGRNSSKLSFKLRHHVVIVTRNGSHSYYLEEEKEGRVVSCTGLGTRPRVYAGDKTKQLCSRFSITAAVTCSMSSNSSCGMRTGNEAREVGGHKDRESHTGSTWSAYMVSSFSFSAS